MNPQAKNRANYVDALESEHPYAVLTKQGRIQILIQPTIERLRKRGQRGWRLFSTVDNGFPDAGPVLTAMVQEAIQELKSTGLGVENNGRKSEAGEA
jgi:hypothetical protein